MSSLPTCPLIENCDPYNPLSLSIPCVQAGASCTMCKRRIEDVYNAPVVACRLCHEVYHVLCVPPSVTLRITAWICPRHRCCVCTAEASLSSSKSFASMSVASSESLNICVLCRRTFCNVHLPANTEAIVRNVYAPYAPLPSNIRLIFCLCRFVYSRQYERFKQEHGLSLLSNIPFSFPLYFAATSPHQRHHHHQQQQKQSWNTSLDAVFNTEPRNGPRTKDSESSSGVVQHVADTPPEGHKENKLMDSEVISKVNSLHPDPTLHRSLKLALAETRKLQKDLAVELQVSPSTISKYLHFRENRSGWQKFEAKLRKFLYDQKLTFSEKLQSEMSSVKSSMGERADERVHQVVSNESVSPSQFHLSLCAIPSASSVSSLTPSLSSLPLSAASSVVLSSSLSPPDSTTTTTKATVVTGFSVASPHTLQTSSLSTPITSLLTQPHIPIDNDIASINCTDYVLDVNDVDRKQENKHKR